MTGPTAARSMVTKGLEAAQPGSSCGDGLISIPTPVVGTEEQDESANVIRQAQVASENGGGMEG